MQNPRILLLLLTVAFAPAFLLADTGDDQKTQKSRSGASGESGDKQAKRKSSPRGASRRSKSNKSPNKKHVVRTPISKNDVREVLKFVRTHHPELRVLLLHLKSADPKQFERAMRDLRRTRERLKQLQAKDMEGYVLELHRWKYKSRAQLLAARLQMTHSDEHEQQLRELLNNKFDVEMAILQRGRTRAVERLERLDAQIERNEQKRAEMIERQVRLMTSAKSKKSQNKKTQSNKTVKRTEKTTVTPTVSPATKR